MNYTRRSVLLQKLIKAEGLDSFLISDPVNVTYVSGFVGHDSMILVTARKNFFITDSRYIEEARSSIRGFEVMLAQEGIFAALRDITAGAKLKKTGFEAMDLSAGVAARLEKAVPGTKFSGFNDLIENMRSIKDPAEIEAIKRSIRLTKKIFREVSSHIKPGISERSLACMIETQYLNHGARVAFDPIVATGINASKPHAQPSSKRIANNSFVMIDMGGKLDHYCSDLTRTVLVGAMKDKFAKIYTIVRTAQQKAIDKIRSGVRISEVDFAARGYIHSQGFGKCFGHSVGHGVGMEVHELPSVSRNNTGFLKSGMVITIEPAIYVPGFGGVRIEDMALVTDTGCEILT